jgi:RNAse (barnase) inhibitor barstar
MGTAISSAPKINIDCAHIYDIESLHTLFAKTMGFPPFYGRNMNAWIDCMGSLDCPEDSMTTVHVKPNQTLTLQLLNTADFKKRCPDLFDTIIDCCAFVNWRRVENGNFSPLIALAYDLN